MMLTITPEDFAKLSISCQRELMGLLGFTQINNTDDCGIDNESIPYEDMRVDADFLASMYSEIPAATSTVKRVIDINPAQAKDLIANISDKSIEMLTRFATGEPISLNDLFGDDKPYANLSDLKRSFVGAVNRRLRTVTGNRQAVLFLTINPVSSESEVQIAVRQTTAISLTHALGLGGLNSQILNQG